MAILAVVTGVTLGAWWRRPRPRNSLISNPVTTRCFGKHIKREIDKDQLFLHSSTDLRAARDGNAKLPT